MEEEAAKRLAITHAVTHGYGIDNEAAHILLTDMGHLMGAIDDISELCDQAEESGTVEVRTGAVRSIIEKHARAAFAGERPADSMPPEPQIGSGLQEIIDGHSHPHNGSHS